jgi:hypothetical protein
MRDAPPTFDLRALFNQTMCPAAPTRGARLPPALSDGAASVAL